jgi:alkylation response protein AidB-like acyl-CoA dehydrogenase
MIDLGFSDEEMMLRGLAADIFGDGKVATDRTRAAEPLGFDPQLWDVLAEAGLPFMALAADSDTAAASAIQQAIVAEEYGRAVAPVPLIEVLAAGGLLGRAPGGDELRQAFLTGRLRPTLVLAPVLSWGPAWVPSGAVCDVALVLHDDRLLAVQRPQTVEACRPVANLADVPLARWDLKAAEYSVLACGATAHELHADAVSQWRLLTAAALNGLRERALEIGATYVKERHAFGVAIGSFQAVQHRLADDVAAGDGARLLVWEAAWARSLGRPEASALAVMAFIHGAETAFRTCRTSVQFHGGYGVTMEYDIQLYFRRAKAWPLLAGPPAGSYLALADDLFGAKGES